MRLRTWRSCSARTHGRWVDIFARLILRVTDCTFLHLPFQKSDGVAASTLVTGSPQVAPAARELVLTFSESCVRPQVVKHTSGVANKLADLLEVPSDLEP